VDTAQAERASIGSLHRSPDHLMKTMSKISPNNVSCLSYGLKLVALIFDAFKIEASKKHTA
jgi:hypothetical protein